MSNVTFSANGLPIHSDPEIMGGVPVFVGTRVPARTLFDYLMDGCSLAEFLDNFPTVKSEQAIQLLEFASRHILGKVEPS
ncbi:DUF433 domain-containing protein [candidate division KSB1 bacterium]|nr:DUF433 domain-containing protein [candidate division KSB1 bacterium]